MARGKNKRRRRGQFERGHVPYITPRKYERSATVTVEQPNSSVQVSGEHTYSQPTRMSDDEFHALFHSKAGCGPYVLNDCTIPEGRLLRPLPSDDGHSHEGYMQSDGDIDPELLTNRIFCLQNTSKLWNTAFTEHKQISPRCAGDLDWDMGAEVQRGLGWEERLKCSQCAYVSPRHKLYRELESEDLGRGRRALAINRSVMVGLNHSGIGYDGLKNILLTMNIPAPSISCMQRNANIVGESLVKLNEDDMRSTREHIHHLATSVGKNAIAIEGDCRYNNSLRSASGKTPSQPATQATYTMCENLTKNKKIIAIATPNKLCKKASVLRGKGQQVTCPNHEGSCTANIPPGQVIGDEKQWAEKCLDQMANDPNPLKFSAFTSDGDSRAFMAVSQRHTDVEQFKDPNHLNKGQRRALTNIKLSKGFFQNKDKTQTVDKLQARLGLEISYRCSAELQQLVSNTDMEADKIVRGSSYLKDAVLQCTLGNHSLCKKYSFVCTGRKRRLWKREFLPQSIVLCPCEEDIEKLRAVIEYRLSKQAVLSVKQNKHTQKCEAVNRAYTRSNPKHITFTRNFKSRVHAAAHLLNNDLASSVLKKCESIRAPLPHGSKPVKRLISDAKTIKQMKDVGNSDRHRKQRACRRKLNYKIYDKCKAQEAECYEKNRFDNMSDEARKAKKKKKPDHCYARSK